MSSILSIDEILNRDKYIIPIYQRDFAWTPEELFGFVDDIEKARENGMKEYYIGTLVTFNRGKEFEVVDGQQRLTALFLLLTQDDCNENINLSFEARPLSTNALENLKKGNMHPYSEHIFYSSVRLLEEKLKVIDDKKAFFEYLKHNVYLLRLELPESIDLNHYFEIMNSRGRQTEAHEELEAYLLSFLSDVKEREVFRIIWEGLCHFDRLIQQGIAERLWNRMCYGDGWAPLLDVDYDSWWKMIKTHVEGDDDSFHGSISQALQITPNEHIRPKVKEDISVSYNSILGFDDFIILCCELIFKKKLNSNSFVREIKRLGLFSSDSDVKSFVYNLLVYRYLFDTYIIKTYDCTWVLSKYVDENEFVPTFGDSNHSIVALESIFASSLDNNNWIYSVLEHLFFNRHESGNDFLLYLEKLLDKFQTKRFNLYKETYLKSGEIAKPYLVIENGKLVDITQ